MRQVSWLEGKLDKDLFYHMTQEHWSTSGIKTDMGILMHSCTHERFLSMFASSCRRNEKLWRSRCLWYTVTTRGFSAALRMRSGHRCVCPCTFVSCVYQPPVSAMVKRLRQATKMYALPAPSVSMYVLASVACRLRHRMYRRSSTAWPHVVQAGTA